MSRLLDLVKSFLLEWGTLLLFGLLLVWNATSFDIDVFAELYHIQAAKEIVASGHWVIPEINHQPYLLRAPFWTWINAIGFNLMGINLWAARLPAIAAALACMALTYLIAGHLFRHRVVAYLSALVLGTMWGFFQWAHISTADLAGTALTLLLVFMYLQWHPTMARRSSQPPRFSPISLLFGALIGLLILTKGVPYLILLSVVIGSHLLMVRKEMNTLTDIRWSPFIWGFLLVISPWMIGVAVQQGDIGFFWRYLAEQPFQRFIGLGPWQSIERDFGFFFSRLLIGLTPYQPFILGVLFDTNFHRRNTSVPGEYLQWLFVWFLAGFIGCAFSAAHEPSWLLSVYPPLAILTGLYLGRMAEVREVTPYFQKSMLFWVMAAMFGAVLFTIFIFQILPDTYVEGYWRFPGIDTISAVTIMDKEIPLLTPLVLWKLWLLPGTVILLVAGGTLYVLHLTGRNQLGGYTLIALTLIMLLYAKGLYLPVVHRPVPQEMAGILNKSAKPADEILILSRYPDFKRMLFYLEADTSRNVRFLTSLDQMRQVLNEKPDTQKVFGVIQEHPYYQLDYTYREHFRIVHTAWKWDLWKLSELTRLLKLKTPVFEQMRTRMLIFESIPDEEVTLLQEL